MLKLYPIQYHHSTIFSKHRFGMELHPPYIMLLVHDRHDIALIILNRDFQIPGQGIMLHHPGVITSGIKLSWDSAEQIFVINQLFHLTCYPMVHC